MVCVTIALAGAILISPAGLTHSDATAAVKLQTPPQAAVPTYSKSATDSLKRHLVVCHGFVEKDEPQGAKCLDVVFPKAVSVEEKAALVFCMNPHLPLSLVEDPFFQQAFGHPFSRCPGGGVFSNLLYLCFPDIRCPAPLLAWHSSWMRRLPSR
jgi:hypothetical protein